MLKDALRKVSGLASIRCGEDIVKLQNTRGRFAEAARAVEALDPEVIELLDADGSVLKVLTLREEEGEEETAGLTGSLDNLSKLAKVLGDISDRAAQRHAEAYKTAFESQTQLVRLIADRLNSLERAWQRVIMLEYQRAAEKGEEGDGELDGLMGSVLKLAEAKAGTKSNGKKESEG